jgi:hypothetical protein
MLVGFAETNPNENAITGLTTEAMIMPAATAFKNAVRALIFSARATSNGLTPHHAKRAWLPRFGVKFD